MVTMTKQLTDILVQNIVDWCGTSLAHEDFPRQQQQATSTINVNENEDNLTVELKYRYICIFIDQIDHSHNTGMKLLAPAKCKD